MHLGINEKKEDYIDTFLLIVSPLLFPCTQSFLAMHSVLPEISYKLNKLYGDTEKIGYKISNHIAIASYVFSVGHQCLKIYGLYTGFCMLGFLGKDIAVRILDSYGYNKTSKAITISSDIIITVSDYVSEMSILTKFIALTADVSKTAYDTIKTFEMFQSNDSDLDLITQTAW